MFTGLMGDSYLTSVFIVKMCASVCVWSFVFFFFKKNKSSSPLYSVMVGVGLLMLSVPKLHVPQVLTTCGESFMWEPQTFTLCVRVKM